MLKNRYFLRFIGFNRLISQKYRHIYIRLLRSLNVYDAEIYHTEEDQGEGVRKPGMSFNVNKWKKSRKPSDGAFSVL